jgi:ArsR family transcriptional regulator, arsenate/arsenite/antimonite-responsive transcriptional repressor
MDVKTIDVCCAPLLSEALDETSAVEMAAAFKVLGTACSCDLEAPVGKSQSTVSHHLSLLADAGLITKEKVGRWVNCTIVPERLTVLRDALAR